MEIHSSHATLRDMPNEDRPRERMRQAGAQALSNAELLAVLLRTGTYQESAVRLAQRVLSEAGSLRGLVDMSLDEMMRIKGIGPTKALQLKAGIELGRRLAASSPEIRTTIRSPRDVFVLIGEDLRYLQKEHFVCLFLNTKNQVIATETLSMGSLNASIVHPREVFLAAIKRSSASLICAHNHPSGDPKPSPEDLDITRRLTEAGELLGIDVLDHVIIGDGTYYSLKENGCL